MPRLVENRFAEVRAGIGELCDPVVVEGFKVEHSFGLGNSTPKVPAEASCSSRLLAAHYPDFITPE